MNVVLFSLLLIFESIQQVGLVHSILFLKEKLFIFCLVGSFYHKNL